MALSHNFAMPPVSQQPENTGPPQNEGRQKASAIPKEQWDQHKDVMRQLYMVERIPFSELRKSMEENHNFKASEQQYRAKFREPDWNFKKNKSKRARSPEPEGPREHRKPAALSHGRLEALSPVSGDSTSQNDQTIDQDASGLDSDSNAAQCATISVENNEPSVNFQPPSNGVQDQAFNPTSQFNSGSIAENFNFDSPGILGFTDTPHTNSNLAHGGSVVTNETLGFAGDYDPLAYPDFPQNYGNTTRQNYGNNIPQIYGTIAPTPFTYHYAVAHAPYFAVQQQLQPQQYPMQFHGCGHQGSPGYNKAFEPTSRGQVNITFSSESSSVPPAPRQSASTKLRQPIHQAAQSGYFEGVEFLIDTDPKCAHVLGADGVSALWVAAQEGHTKIVQLLINHQVDLNVADTESKRTAIHQAAQGGHLRVVELLLKHKAKPDPKDCDGITPLWSAAQKGHLQIVKALLDEGADPNVGSEDSSRRPIHQAAQNGHVAIVRLFLDHKNPKIEADYRDSHGITPLWSASQQGHHQIVKMLLDQKADMEVEWIGESRRPIHQAAQNGHLETVRLLLQYGANASPEKDSYNEEIPSPFWLAAQNGNAAIATLLIDKGADVDFSVSPSKRRPIHQAAQNGHIEIIRLLIEQEADLDAGEEDSWPAMMIAAQQGHKETVELLTKHQANVNAEEKDGANPLWIASQQGHTEIVKFLLEEGAKSFSTKSARRRPIHQASQNGHFEVLKLLVGHDPGEVDVEDKKGWRPLTFAAQSDKPDRLAMMKYLVENGAKVSSE